MGKVLIIQQPFGLGDVIWGQTIAHDYIEQGYSILWPVKKEWVTGLRRAYPAIEFIDWELLPIDFNNRRLYEEKGFTYLPMRFSEYLMGKPYKFHMESKYSYLGKDWRRWKEHAMPQRDFFGKERDLLLSLGIAEGGMDRFNLIATNFGSDASYKLDIQVGNGYKNINMRLMPGYSLFDWATVIQKATTIHAVSSSTLYLFEILLLEAREIHLYSRKPIETNLDYVRFLFSKPYILHE